ncbi:hypothetical protein [Burkholderia ambifaria]|uniref:Uncharacterized protein n=1 Tax=Burkholderia ambifaria MEX-5 TaxID=396597 RepID=B1T2S0_9BURK|nr:hypothetical protein [Burkholderia ambifaria]EDT42149.1 conserved hypothetical protein [Burkholderia ambifaria MEX-5]
MQLNLTEATERMRRYPQQVWSEDPSCAGRYTALFAGHDAYLQLEGGAWHLYYQSLRSAPLVSFAAAQQGAPAFARAVLAQLASLIVD